MGAAFLTGSDLLFYEGLHGTVVTDKVNVARHADLKIGVVPVINLEWIQKIHRDAASRGYSTEAVTDTILRRMPDYVRYMCPQFTETDINFQRIPTVDTSNPFIARWIPTPDESMVVIRFRNTRGFDFCYLLSMIQHSFMSRCEFDRDSGRKTGFGDADYFDAADFAVGGAQTARGVTRGDGAGFFSARRRWRNLAGREECRGDRWRPSGIASGLCPFRMAAGRE